MQMFPSDIYLDIKTNFTETQLRNPVVFQKIKIWLFYFKIYLYPSFIIKLYLVYRLLRICSFITFCILYPLSKRKGKVILCNFSWNFILVGIFFQNV